LRFFRRFRGNHNPRDTHSLPPLVHLILIPGSNLNAQDPTRKIVGDLENKDTISLIARRSRS
jgi:hypothetical protein